MSLPDEPLLYLIGANHAVQFKSGRTLLNGELESVRKKREAFTAHVAEIIDKLDIEILAEEFSDEAKEEQQVRRAVKDFAERVGCEWESELEQFNWETVLQQLRKAKDIEQHRFCDPESNEKKTLGIEVDPRKETEADWRKREQVWLSRIADCKRRRVLFVCGDDHYDAFAQLLESNGFNVRRGAHL